MIIRVGLKNERFTEYVNTIGKESVIWGQSLPQPQPKTFYIASALKYLFYVTFEVAQTH